MQLCCCPSYYVCADLGHRYAEPRGQGTSSSLCGSMSPSAHISFASVCTDLNSMQQQTATGSSAKPSHVSKHLDCPSHST